MAHVVVNMEPASVWQGQTDTFLRSYKVNVCGNDYTATTHQGIRNLFAPPSATNADPRPVFVAINCLSNSPSHAHWQVLLMEFYNGGGAQDFSARIAEWRNVIDSVQAPPPLLSNARLAGGNFEFTFPGQRGRTNRVECATMAGPGDFLDWTVITNIYGTNTAVTFRDTNTLLNERRFFRVRRL